MQRVNGLSVTGAAIFILFLLGSTVFSLDEVPQQLLQQPQQQQRKQEQHSEQKLLQHQQQPQMLQPLRQQKLKRQQLRQQTTGVQTPVRIVDQLSGQAAKTARPGQLGAGTTSDTIQTGPSSNDLDPSNIYIDYDDVYNDDGNFSKVRVQAEMEQAPTDSDDSDPLEDRNRTAHLGIFSKATVVKLTNVQRGDFVFWHNRYRGLAVDTAVDSVHRRVPTNMKRVFWSRDLERDAKDWAIMCECNLRTVTYGQTQLKAPKSSGVNIQKIVKSWFDEASSYYKFKTNCPSESDCSNYAQATWANSWQIGCAIGNCGGDKIQWTVCNYWPKGVTGGPPFMVGTEPCSRCSNFDELSNCADFLCNLGKTRCEQVRECPVVFDSDGYSRDCLCGASTQCYP